jgi:hypothetical protein
LISTEWIVVAAILTGFAVGLAAYFARWRPPTIALTAVSTVVVSILWRAASNLLQFNRDFMPAVSIGDMGCLVAGAVGPAAVAVAIRSRQARLTWVPVMVGAVAGFVINVVVL